MKNLNKRKSSNPFDVANCLKKVWDQSINDFQAFEALPKMQGNETLSNPNPNTMQYVHFVSALDTLFVSTFLYGCDRLNAWLRHTGCASKKISFLI